ncbi:hypothetical protein ABES38_07210 [Bacillus gobiensis]|uniref:WapI family immunity protein n=1 Tax=Bacillus gobiensis TaxID=1441095 RepID=UPI003D21D74E
MRIFKIKNEQYSFNIYMKDFSAEGDPFYGGAYFTGYAVVFSSGFQLKTTHFYFDNHVIKNLHEKLKDLFEKQEGSLVFYSEAKELKLSMFLKPDGELNLEVDFTDLHSDDRFNCQIPCHYSTIPDVKEELKNFLEVFKYVRA